jgi:hypothetical protein
MLSASSFHSSARSHVLVSAKVESVAAKLSPAVSKPPCFQHITRAPLRTIYASVAAPGISAPPAESLTSQVRTASANVLAFGDMRLTTSSAFKFSSSIVDAPVRDATLKTSNSVSSVLQQAGDSSGQHLPQTSESDSNARYAPRANCTMQCGSYEPPCLRTSA